MKDESDTQNQVVDHEAEIQEVLGEIQRIHENPQVMKSPEEFEAMERELNQLTDRLSALLLRQQIQHSLDSDDLHVALLLQVWKVEPIEKNGKSVTGPLDGMTGKTGMRPF